MNRSNPSTVVGGGEMKREACSVVSAKNSDAASLTRISRSVIIDPVSTGRPLRQSVGCFVVFVCDSVDTTVSSCG